MDEERETMDFEQLLGENLGSTGDMLKDMEPGSTERLNEAKIYDMQCKASLEVFEKTNNVINNEARLELEREKNDKELELRREIELEKIAAEDRRHEKELELKREFEQIHAKELERKDKNERNALWCKVALAGVEVSSGIVLGLIYLKANFAYGGLIGKDGKRFWDEIKHIKIS